FLLDVISEYQSSFVPHRMIFDNVLAAFGTIHCLKRRGKIERRKIILKLDMAKAYDRVEWIFLERIMHIMEFHDRFIQLIWDAIPPSPIPYYCRGGRLGISLLLGVFTDNSMMC
ncbi:unnamed protein product, partial [Prunus armeniaca]